MASAKTAWGIDIGNRALKAVKLALVDGRLHVEDIDVIEHESILSSVGDNKESLIQEALGHFVARHDVSKIPVAIGVSGQSSFARFIKLPPVEPKKIPEIVRFEAIQQIPFPLDEVEWAYQLFQAPDSPEVEVGIFAMRKELVNRQISFFKNAGMTVQAVQMNPLAVYNAMYYDDRLKGGTTMIVDVGAENTDLIIADGETVWLRTLPIGGNNFTESLAKAFKVNFAKAEELKRTASTSRYAKQIFQAMRPVFGDLVAEIQRSIGFYASVHRESRIKKIVPLGGTFRLPTLQKYLQQNLQLEVERLNGFTGGAPTDARLATALNDNLISMVGAYGLAVQAMDHAKITSSLLPEEIRRERIWKEKTKWFATAAAIFIVGTLAVGAKSYMEKTTLESDAAQNNQKQVDATAKAASDADSKWAALSAPSDIDKRISNIDALPKYRDLWPLLLDDIASHTPYKTYAKQIPRDQREQMVIQSITSAFVPDIDHYLQLSEDAFISEGGAEVSAHAGGMRREVSTPNATKSTPRRGFLLNIKCTSPNKNSKFVAEEFLGRLKYINEASAAASHKPYFIPRSTFLNASQIFQDKAIMQAAATAVNAARNAQNLQQGINGITFIPAGGSLPLPPPPASATEPVVYNPLKDPETGEDRSQDWEFSILIAVELDPAPAPANSPGPRPPGR